MGHEVVLPVPMVSQGPQPWCWAACSRMVIGYYRALRFTPALTELVELGHVLPRGSCEGDAIPDAARSGNTITAMRVLMTYLGRRAIERHPAEDFETVVSRALASGSPVILHLGTAAASGRSHVVVARGHREIALGDETSMELLINDPALTEPCWWPASLIVDDLIELLVVRKDVMW